MKVAAIAHFSMPWRNCGSETVIHELMKAAHRTGHDTRMWVTHQDSERNWRGTEPDVELDGVLLHRVRNVILAGHSVRRWRPDVIVTHHDHATYSIKLARELGARSVFLTHNDFDLNRRPLQLGPDLTVFNSQWVKESLARFGEPKASMTFHPPLTPERHRVDMTGDAVTLINLNAHKGAHLFYDLAERMRDTPFLGVTGGHGIQVKAPRLGNLTVLEHGPDMKRVWSQTRVLVMPSVAESYGLTAVEAAMNGIPTVAHPTPGLIENLGGGGLFCDRDNPDEWVSMLRGLQQPLFYREASAYASQLGEQVLKESNETLKQWCEWVG